MYLRGHGSDSRGFLGIPEHLGSSAGRGKRGRRALRLGTGTMLTQWRLAPSRRTGLSDASLASLASLLSPDPDSSDISDDASGTKAVPRRGLGADRWPDSSLATTGGSSSGTVCLTDRSRRQDTRGGFFEVPASRAKRASRRWARGRSLLPERRSVEVEQGRPVRLAERSGPRDVAYLREVNDEPAADCAMARAVGRPQLGRRRRARSSLRSSSVTRRPALRSGSAERGCRGRIDASRRRAA